jgi:hypothetical protein
LRSLLEEAIEKGKDIDHEKAEREIEEESNQLAKKRFEMPFPIWSPRFTLTPVIARG